MAATKIVIDAAYLVTNSKLHVLDDTDGATLVVVSAQSMSNPGGQLVFVDKKSPREAHTLMSPGTWCKPLSSPRRQSTNTL